MTGNRKYEKPLWFLMMWAFLLPCFTGTVFAQEDLPDTPHLIRVTVDHADNGVLIQWKASRDTTVDYYHLYRMNNGEGTKIFSFSPETLEYKHMTSGLENLAYSVTAEDTLDGSASRESLLGDNEHKAIEVSLAFDPCEPAIQVTWTGYVGWENNISGYRIYGGPSGVQPEYLGFKNYDARSYTHTDIAYGVSYEYYVEAIHTSGITSLSPLEEITTSFPEAPETLRIDEVSVINNNTVELRFTADVEGPVNNFRVLRRSESDSPFTEVETIWNSNQPRMLITDMIQTSHESYEYRVEALYQPASCASPVVISQSNPGTSILLNASVDNLLVQLSWNPYESYETGLSGYIIQRRSGDGEFIDMAAVGAETTSWQESIESVINGFQAGELQYKIVALGNQVEGSDPGISHSNVVSVAVETHMQIPNAFTPGKTTNYLFKPVLDFAPKSYTMIIFDRGGRKLFETNDPEEGWDGTYRGGGYALEGVYVYFIRFTDHTNKSQTLTGNLTVIYPQEY